MPEVPAQSTTSPLTGDGHRDGDVTGRPAFRDNPRVIATAHDAIAGAP
jgi:hypothetical protein